jgi:hypothetical protein
MSENIFACLAVAAKVLLKKGEKADEYTSRTHTAS